MSSSVPEGPLNCLAINRDYSQVVVAGRNGKQYQSILFTLLIIFPILYSNDIFDLQYSRYLT